MLSFFRSIKKRWVLTLLNIIGYGVGVAACLLVLHNILYETSYDKFNKSHENIYRVQLDHFYSDVYQNSTAISFYPIGPELQNRYPEVIDFTRVQIVNNATVEHEENRFLEERVFTADSSFFRMFSLDLIKGSFSNLNRLDVFMSESLARKYFGQDDPINQMITVLGRSCEVKGVYKDLPPNTHLQHDMIVVRPNFARLEENWAGYAYHTYLMLEPGTDIERLEDKLKAFSEEFSQVSDEQSSVEYSWKMNLMKLSDIHLKSDVDFEHQANGNMTNIYILIIVAAFVLLISGFNYVSLTNSINAERIGDVFVRKLHGASKASVLKKYAVESLILNLTGITLAVILTLILSRVSETQALDFNFAIDWSNPSYYLLLGGVIILSFIFSGLIPALVFTSLNPLKYLKGEYFRSKKNKNFGKVLSMLQFAISFILISGAFTINKQLNYINQHDLGFENKDVVVLNTPRMPYEDNRSSLNKFRTDLMSSSLIQDVGFSEFIPGVKYTRDVSIRLEDEPAENAIFCYAQTITSEYLKVYDIDLKAGRSFDNDRDADIESIMINEALARELGITDYNSLINKIVVMPWHEEYRTFKIVGVVEDYHHESIKNAVQPCVFVSLRNDGLAYNTSIKLLPRKDAKEVVQFVETTYNTNFPDRVLDLFYADVFYKQQFESDVQFANLIELFALLAILMSGVGLLGLASNETRKRTREVAIRKVNGAGMRDITKLFVMHFLKQIGVTMLIALPVSLYIADNWLDNFAARVDIGLWFFIWPILITILISVLSMGHHVFKVAIVNPVRILKDER
ncbi:ABC transporter permease [Fulvivirga sediminis]|uniref:ABC transporter permease n=1 Tax=Fulvivirga sediminis TaxID=2803949 RepID=A0A937FB66_9BACT|nr:ABC transporter permease [Fulvivirga sediminis]MBL3658741.1 ABC transporter permease [Fulvivirga sediminis]